MPAGIICDLDGTLVDSRSDLSAAVNVVRRHFGHALLDEDEVARQVGNGLTRLLQRCVPEAAASDGLEQARAVFDEHYLAHCCDRTRPYPGIDRALRRLHAAGWGIGVLTNKPLRYTRRIVDHCGWAPIVGGAVVGGDLVRKPDPAGIHQVLAVLGHAPAGSWMVGDHDTDLQAGRAAGCRVAYCTWGIGRPDDGPVDLRCDHTQALLDRLLAGAGVL